VTSGGVKFTDFSENHIDHSVSRVRLNLEGPSHDLEGPVPQRGTATGRGRGAGECPLVSVSTSTSVHSYRAHYAAACRSYRFAIVA